MGIKFDAALTGFNNNFRHKGKVYHLQTEDSGEGHPHIITHIFVDGHIIATRKASYEEFVGQPDLKAHVRSMMREQHKAMALAIRDGVFDDDQPYPREVRETASSQSAVDEEKKKSRLRGISGVYRSVRRRGSRPPPPPTALRGHGRPSGVARAVRAPSPVRMRPAREVVEDSEHAFGEELLTDKTLEEVIASYLSEDTTKG
jgi:hypothetical protein